MSVVLGLGLAFVRLFRFNILCVLYFSLDYFIPVLFACSDRCLYWSLTPKPDSCMRRFAQYILTPAGEFFNWALADDVATARLDFKSSFKQKGLSALAEESDVDRFTSPRRANSSRVAQAAVIRSHKSSAKIIERFRDDRPREMRAAQNAEGAHPPPAIRQPFIRESCASKRRVAIRKSRAKTNTGAKTDRDTSVYRTDASELLRL